MNLYTQTIVTERKSVEIKTTACCNKKTLVYLKKLYKSNVLLLLYFLFFVHFETVA